MQNNKNPSNKINRAAEKRTIIIVFAICVLFIGVFFLIENIHKILPGEETAEEGKKLYNHYPPDYDEDIFTDEYYLGLNRLIAYSDGAVTVMLTAEECRSHSGAAAFFADFFEAAVNGDAELYNGFFSGKYYEDNSPKKRFTMQKLYNIKITKLQEEPIASEGGVYSVYTFAVEYMIRRNNGTLRQDMGSDALRAQVFVLDDSGGEFKINSVYYYAG